MGGGIGDPDPIMEFLGLGLAIFVVVVLGVLGLVITVMAVIA